MPSGCSPRITHRSKLHDFGSRRACVDVADLSALQPRPTPCGCSYYTGPSSDILRAKLNLETAQLG